MYQVEKTLLSISSDSSVITQIMIIFLYLRISLGKKIQSTLYTVINYDSIPLLFMIITLSHIENKDILITF